MPRKAYTFDPIPFNSIRNKIPLHSFPLTFATTNPNKLREIKRILKDSYIEGCTIDVPEIQSLDSQKVISHKAIEGWKRNNYNPLIVEDTSLEIFALNGRPGPYIKDFSDYATKSEIVSVWLKNKERRALIRVVLGVYDGKEVFIREGITTGTISESLRGSNGFGFDDMFIPDGQRGYKKTFAEMTDKEKDMFSPRQKALFELINNPIEINNTVFMLDEPFSQEVDRVSWHKLTDRKALKFAFALECLDDNKINSSFMADIYHPICFTENLYFQRYSVNENSASLGLLMTDIDRNNLILNKNGLPLVWQMGPERRSIAIAQRSDFFINQQNPRIYSVLNNIESDGKYAKRNGRKFPVIERCLGISDDSQVTRAIAIKEIGYKKLKSDVKISRREILENGLFNKIGKYPRSLIGVGSMPPVSGWRDVLVTAAINFSLVFAARNSLFIDLSRQIKLIADAKSVLKDLGLGKRYTMVAGNIGAAIGCGSIKNELNKIERLITEADVKLFRIYTINSDVRLVRLCEEIRRVFGDEIELFVGQIAEKRQAEEIADLVNGMIFGHGGGRQCTSAANGMAISTLEEIYDVVTDEKFNNISILVEGGVGTNIGPLLILGVDGVLYNQQLTRCTIETGDVYFQHKSGKICQPYHGSASATTMLIESVDPKIRKSRLDDSGRARNVEGKPGYCYYSEKANSMVFYLNEFKSYIARTFADLGVKNYQEFRSFVNNYNGDLLRIISQEAKHVASAYKNG